MYEGPERRKDMSEVVQRLTRLETLEEQAGEWRLALCKKIDKINSKLDKIAWAVIGALVTLVTALILRMMKCG